VIYGAPLVVFTKVKPVAPVWVPIVAAVVLKPLGVVQVPLAVVQYRNWMEPMLGLPAAGIVKLKRWFTTPLGLEPPSLTPAWSVKLREVSSAAYTPCIGKRLATRTNTTQATAKTIRTLPFTLI